MLNNCDSNAKRFGFDGELTRRVREGRESSEMRGKESCFGPVSTANTANCAPSRHTSQSEMINKCVRVLSEMPLMSLGSCLCGLTGELVTSVVEPRGSLGLTRPQATCFTFSPLHHLQS